MKLFPSCLAGTFMLLIATSAPASAQECFGFAAKACEYLKRLPETRTGPALTECQKEYPGASGAGITTCAAIKLGARPADITPKEDRPAAPKGASNCAAIQDPRQRLACYDGAVSPPMSRDIERSRLAMLRKLSDPDSARWGPIFRSGPVVCGSVNAKNRMGGYVGRRGFVYFPKEDRAFLMFSGRTDPDYTYRAAVYYCRYCVGDPRAEQSIRSHCEMNKEQIRHYKD
jgi:hypothetical protein